MYSMMKGQSYDIINQMRLNAKNIKKAGDYSVFGNA